MWDDEEDFKSPNTWGCFEIVQVILTDSIYKLLNLKY